MRYLTILLTLISLNLNSSTQNITRVKIYIIDFVVAYPFATKAKLVKKRSDLKVVIKKPSNNPEWEKYINSLIQNKDSSISNSRSLDLKIKCVIYRKFGKLILYVDRFGNVQFKGKIYKNLEIGKFIIKHVPIEYVGNI